MQILLWMRQLAAALVVQLVQQLEMRLVVVMALLLGGLLVVQLVLQSALMNILISHMHRRKFMSNMHPIGAGIRTVTIAHPAREKKVAVDQTSSSHILLEVTKKPRISGVFFVYGRPGIGRNWK
jgi:hypothetical protein